MTEARELPAAPSVAVIILNWNGWADTLECLESVMRLDHQRLSVIVCDNASTDGSMDRLKAWAKGELVAPVRRAEMASYSNPPCAKPLDYVILDRAEAEARTDNVGTTPKLTLIQTGGNLGFAGGNNVGLRHALVRGVEYCWLLNADTVVRPDSLSPLLERMESVEGAGICGSTLRYYEAPEVNQELAGCAYYPLFGLARRLGGNSSASKVIDADAVERKLFYVSGASSFVGRAFLEDVGLMNEDYFLYCEEVDWAERAKGRFRAVYAPESIVFHKKGASTGSTTKGRTRSPKSSYYLWRARIIFSRKYHPTGLAAITVLAAITALYARIKDDIETSDAIIRAMRDGIKKRD